MGNNTLLNLKLDLIAEAMNAYRIHEIAAVIRRPHVNPDDGTITERIDFYPHWNQWGTFGKYKVASEYLDHEWQIERFERSSGLKIADLPAYEGQQALQRRFGATSNYEVTVKTSFKLLVQPRPGGEEGKDDKTLIRRYITAGNQVSTRKNAPPPPPNPSEEKPPESKPAPIQATRNGEVAVGAKDKEEDPPVPSNVDYIPKTGDLVWVQGKKKYIRAKISYIDVNGLVSVLHKGQSYTVKMKRILDKVKEE